MKYITLTTPQTASLAFQGRMYNYLSNVYLSSGSVRFPSTTAINIWASSPLVSAFFPAFSGYPISSQYYYNTDDNHFYVTVSLSGLSGTGNIDVILYNVAGYSKLSNEGYLIKKN